MANKSDKAAAAVEALFKKKPDASTDEFLEVAIAADRSVKGIGKRSFNATYLLPMKRAAGLFGTKKSSTRKKAKAKRRAARKTGSRKTTRKKAARKKATRKKATRSRRRRSTAGNGAVSPQGRERVRELILERDRMVLDTVGKKGDPKAAYELGARLDSYIDEIAEAISSN